ncbi:MAG: hypothetical protein JW969_10950, partial [Spirochaetales bacterium]|nr:hypothetical protein [Spirochaetales bacterium]
MKKLKISFKQDFILYLILAFFCLVPSVLVFFLLQNEVQKFDLLLETQMERMVFSLIESFRENSNIEGILSDNKEVLGFGIYNARGRPLLHTGTAPPDIISAISDDRAMHPVYDTGKKSFIIVRRIGMMPPPEENGPMPFMMRPMRMRRNDPGRLNYIYFEYSLESEWFRRDLIRNARYLIPVFVLALFGLFSFLIKRNNDYKKRLESQKHLALLGEMSRTLSHEIKNPLSAIRIQTGYLKKIIPGENQEELNIIEEEISRLSLLTRKISDFVRDPLGNPEKIELNSFLKDILKR